MTESPAPAPPPHRRRWLRRVLWAALAVVLLAVAFHRPLLRSIVRTVGPQAAATRGLSLEWEVQGNVLGNLDLRSVKAQGDEDHWLPKATAKRVALEYDLRSLVGGNMEKAIKSITLEDVDAVIDLRKLPEKKVEVKLEEPVKTPSLVWPKVINATNVTASVTLASGKTLHVRGLTAQVGPGMPGILSIDELRLEPGDLWLKNITAQMEWDSRRAVIRNLRLPQDIVIEELVVDLTGWEERNFAATAIARLGEATAKVSAQALQMAEEHRNLKADVQIVGLRAQELHTLGLPKNILFDGAQVSLKVTGDPDDTANLSGDVTLGAANIRVAGVKLDRLDATLGLADSKAVLKSLRTTRGANVVEAVGTAQLPPILKEWQKTAWQAKASGNLPDVNQMLEKPLPVQGSYNVQARAEGIGKTATKVTADVVGEAAAYGTYQLPQLKTTLTLNGKAAEVRLPDLVLGNGNRVNLTATMQLEDQMPVNAEWQASITNPATFFAATGLKPPAAKLGGSIQTQGRAQFQIRDITAKNYDRIDANFTFAGKDVVYGDGRVQSIALTATAAAGRLDLKPLVLQIDGKNEVRLQGTTNLNKPFAFDVDGSITLPDMPALNGLLAQFKVPAFQTGSLFAKVDAEGQLSPWKANGNISLSASDVRTDKMPDAADAVIDADFEGTRANLGAMEITLGPWKLNAKGAVDQRRADLTELRLLQNQTLLVTGRVQVPYDVMKGTGPDPVDVDITAKDLRIHEILRAAGIDNIPASVVNADIKLKGRLETLQGEIHATVDDFTIPKAPKAFTPASAVLDMTLSAGRVHTVLKVDQPPLQPLTLTADTPVNIAQAIKTPKNFMETPIEARLVLPRSELGFLREYAPDLIERLPGTVVAEADISGTVGDPIISAAIDADIPEVIWSKPSLPSVRDGRLRIRSSDRQIRVEDFSVTLAGGRLRATGGIDATDLTTPTVDLRIDAYEALVFRDQGTSLRANAALTGSGTLEAAHVAGTVEFVRGRIFKEIDMMPELSLPSDVPPLPPDTQRRNTTVTLPAFMNNWTFDVHLRTRDPLLISGNLANGAMSVDAHIGGTGAAPVATGGGTIDRLLVKLPFSQVKVTSGFVTLNADRLLDPALDIRGESRIGNYDITMYVYGDSSNPKTRFISVPPLPEHDIVALIATGATLNGSSSEAGAEAAGRAAVFYLTELYRKIFKKKKVVREDPQRLHITFNPSTAERSTSDTIRVTYDLTERWRITGGYAQTGRVRGFLAYLLRFGKAAKAVDENNPDLARTRATPNAPSAPAAPDASK